MIQINLLPDIKQEYLKTQRVKYRFIAVSVVVSIAFAALVVVLAAYVHIVLVAQINGRQKSIDKSLATIHSDKDAVKVVTIQNQLNGLTALADKKPSMKRMFTYIQQVTPKDVKLNSVTFDSSDSSLKLDGTTSSYKSANIFSDTLKHAQFNYTQDGRKNKTLAFSKVIFQNLSGDSNSAGGSDKISFSVTLSYEPRLFDSSLDNTSITIPELSSAEIDQPSANVSPAGNNTQPFTDSLPSNIGNGS